jgi:serine/threonine-protein kinase
MKECPDCNRCFPDNLNHCPGDGTALRTTLLGDTVLDGRYQLERRLGQGGMGIVFKGRHVFLKTQHAIKIILPDLVGNDPSLVTRFRQEAMAAAAIRHPNIISVTDFGVVNNTMPFLVMEFLEGCSLHDLLGVEGRLPARRASEFMLAVAAGVAAAHRQGIVHRDLKPLNIMMRDDCAVNEGVKVLDFGLAKIKSGDLLGSFVAAKTQGLMGSPFYMAPEQWGDDEPDARSDIYSLGIIFYQTLAGEVPFKGNSIPSIMNKHLTTAPPPLAEKGVEVPPGIERVIMRALEKDPDKRQQSAEEFAQELRAALAASGLEETEVGASTNPDIGLRTVAIKEPSTVPPEAPTPDAPAPAPVESAPAEVKVGAQTNAEEGARPKFVRGAETVAVSFVPGETSQPPAELQQSRPPTADAPAEVAASPAPEAPAASEASAPVEERPAEVEAKSAEEASVPTLPSAETRALEAEAHKTFAVPSKATQPLITRQETVHKATAERAVAPPAAVAPPPVVTPAPPVHVPRPAPPPVVPTGAGVVAKPGRPVALLASVGVLVLLCVVAGLYLLLRKPGEESASNTTTNAAPNAGTAANAGTQGQSNSTQQPTPAPPARPDLVAIPGGTFMMGRDDVPARTSDAPADYLLWLYSQWPAHAVTVAPFAIDKTEVTNAEYADFVEKTGHFPPADWGGKRPPAGHELWPVRNVSLEDAEAFAKWRSERDGVKYRLPTEEEWEYAARGGDASRLFPWGREWADGRANVESDELRPVGSFPDGATPQGVLDMIGNVWEWTSTVGAVYKGNDVMTLAPGDKGKVIVRGGSYQSEKGGTTPVTATARRWVPRTERNPFLGFRLVRPGG